MNGCKKVSNNNNWYHKEIIESIKNDSPKLSSTLAVLPDTKEINTFNLEAEAVKQGEHVAVRQVVSNIKTYKNDLKYFDWFLIKSGDQGIMTNKSKQLLSNYLLVNDSFFIYKKWLLPDNTDLLLMRRKELNTEISEINCDFVIPKINIKKLKNGINIELFAKGSLFDSSKLLIDLENKFEKHKINIAIGQGQINNIERNKKCYKLSQNISYPLKANDKFKSNTQLITKKNMLINLLSDYSFSVEKIDDKNTEYILSNKKFGNS